MGSFRDKGITSDILPKWRQEPIPVRENPDCIVRTLIHGGSAGHPQPKRRLVKVIE
ncbi:hypothetical protein FRC03_012643 [Tulasnella sp. 419]|nr:hypothetical protein FRC02_006594 [Tulasnella sp. 418]KAG8951085.1 hypothetical protein FRC03_012643 [Tulasnella sp. 419]